MRGPLRRRMQMIFQDPYAFAQPAELMVEQFSAEAGELSRPRGERHRVARARRRAAVAGGLEPSAAEKFPHEFSGGQRQRISIAARARGAPESIIATSPSRRWTSTSRRRSSTC